jgi:hypothetical protein
MQRKTKFGVKLNEIIITQKKVKKTYEEDSDNIIRCQICEEYNVDNGIRYSNCILKGTKKEKIGRYKHCDKAICIHCIKECEKLKVRNTVRFKYQEIKRRKKRTFYKTGIIDNFDKNNIINIVSGDYIYALKKENILYKLKTCPWCVSHRLRDWHNNIKKFPKIKNSQNKKFPK